MKIIYIAGPFRGDTEQNIKNAQTVASFFVTAGVAFICPHSIGAPHDHMGAPDTYWLDATLEMLNRCDAIQLVEGWEKSSGTFAEVSAARDDGKPIFQPNMVAECIGWALK